MKTEKGVRPNAKSIKVKKDEFAAREILKTGLFPAPACFHFQQVAEKSLKALLIFYGKEFPKTHDLIALAGLLEHILPEIKDYKEDIEYLNRYYIETRYPDDYPEITLEECRKASESAACIKKFVLNKIQGL